ncbi:unnamed protein product, partial [Mesorhabditis belari]|uniref:Uncharacterized protein n=1 Tax=Mesorhabditis belari TaxID=2138241 RepID=A0AAF3FE75_9BILA
MFLAATNRLSLPCCSNKLYLLAKPATVSNSTSQRRNASQLPPAISSVFEYAADCNITQAMQWGMEGIHAAGVPWAGTFIVSGIALRLLTAPTHVLAEKLFAKRIHAQNFFTQAILKKVSEHYKIGLSPTGILKTEDPKVLDHTEKLIKENVPGYLVEQRLQASRIQNLKICSVPIWIFSSFALRNIINGDFAPAVPGALWIPDLLLPDPYFILPAIVGSFGFLNLWAQRKIYPAIGTRKNWLKTYDASLAFMTTAAVYIMAHLPAVIPLYWLVVSITGFAQTQMLRHPRIKSIFDIKRLPTDSKTPIRDLFLTRKMA